MVTLAKSRQVTCYLPDELEKLTITNFKIEYECSRLFYFISRTPMLKARDEAIVELHRGLARIQVPLFSQKNGPGSRVFFVEVQSDEFIEQLMALTWVCKSSESLLSTVEILFICDDLHDFRRDDEGLYGEWLKLLSQFTTMKELFLSKGAVHRMAPALCFGG